MAINSERKHIMEVNWNAVALVAGLFFYGTLAAVLLRKPLKTAVG